MNMAWTDARDFAQVAAEDRQHRWLELATAARAARVDEKGWQKIMRGLR